MRLVVDTNILFTYFWKNSFTKKLLLKINLELFSPDYALEEIKFHMQEILDKTKISKQEFIELKREIKDIINFVPLENYSDLLKEALKLSADMNDIDFIALSLKLKCPVWSNDQHLKQQNKIKIFTTRELINLLSIH